MNATNDIKVHPLTAISISAMNFVNSNCDWYDIRYLSLMMVEVSCYLSFLYTF